MQLDKIKAIHLQIGATAVHKGFKVRQCVPIGHMRVQPAASFGGHKRARAGKATFAQDCGNDPFGSAIAIDISGVNKIDTGIKGGVQGGFGVIFTYLAPSAADGPSAKADAGGLKAGFAKVAGR